MTCIVGLRSPDGHVIIGGDRGAATNRSTFLVDSPKVFKNNGFVIGYTSSFRMGQILEHVFEPPEVPEDARADDGTMLKYMVSSFVPALIECFRATGYNRNDNGRHEGGAFILGYEDFLCEVEADYQVQVPLWDYIATGSGYSEAYGALHVLDGLMPFEKSSVLMALGAAESINPSVKGPFDVLTTQEK